jgi:hypothetical protein
MIVPTAAQMLKNAERTFETVIKPDLQTTSTRSAAATIGHMLRLCVVRIENEGQILFDEVARAKALLARVQPYMAQIDEQMLAQKLAQLLAARQRDAAIYPSLALMAEDVGRLRQGVCDALEILQSRRLDAQGDALHEELRAYVAWQLDQEFRMIEPATAGFGPRR